MGYACKFNGSSSKIDLGVDCIGTKAVTVMGWIKPSGFGEGKEGITLTNGKLILGRASSTNAYYITSTGKFPFVKTAPDSFELNKFQFVAVTRETDGTTNFYIGDKNTAPALSGNADQDSGTPIAGTTNVFIGSNSVADRAFDGLINKLKVIEGILTIDQITQYWSETLKEV